MLLIAYSFPNTPLHSTARGPLRTSESTVMRPPGRRYQNITCQTDTRLGPVYDTAEHYWHDTSVWLREHDYKLLGPRYDTDWEPSWEGMDKWWCEDRLMVPGVSCGVSAELGYVYDAEGLNARGAMSWMPYVSMTANQCRRSIEDPEM